MATHLEGLEFVGALTWPAVFEIWARNEESNEAWQKCAHDRGFDDWREWRGTYVEPLGLARRTWGLYRVADPTASVPRFLGGPFTSWVDQIYGDAGMTPTFARIAERLTGIKNDGVLSLLRSFPLVTTITGVMTEPGIIVVEGMHRCGAIATDAAGDRKLRTELMIALGSELPDDPARFATKIGGHRKGQDPLRRD